MSSGNVHETVAAYLVGCRLGKIFGPSQLLTVLIGRYTACVSSEQPCGWIGNKLKLTRGSGSLRWASL